VIVVEDDPSVLRALRRLLRAEKFNVIGFERPSALLATDLPVSDACLLVDVHLPEMNGVRLCETLSTAGSSLPVILMSGHLDARTKAMMRQADAVAVLIKPFDRVALLGAIGKALAVQPSR
jgi:FixJ family two-component response regulator